MWIIGIKRAGKIQYSSPCELTDRQKSYVSELGLSTAYTPQIILDGTAELHANDPQQLHSGFEKALKDAKIPTSLDSVNFDGISAVLGPPASGRRR